MPVCWRYVADLWLGQNSGLYGVTILVTDYVTLPVSVDVTTMVSDGVEILFSDDVTMLISGGVTILVSDDVTVRDPADVTMLVIDDVTLMAYTYTDFYASFILKPSTISFAFLHYKIYI